LAGRIGRSSGDQADRSSADHSHHKAQHDQDYGAFKQSHFLVVLHGFSRIAATSSDMVLLNTLAGEKLRASWRDGVSIEEWSGNRAFVFFFECERGFKQARRCRFTLY
jgi:hypothetical protein